MPMRPEIVVAILAIIKIGGIFLLLFSGFGAGAVAGRLADADAKALLTADGLYRRVKAVPMKPIADQAGAIRAAPRTSSPFRYRHREHDGRVASVRRRAA